MAEDHDAADRNILPLTESHTLSEKQAVMVMLGYKGEFHYGEGDESFEYSLNDYLYDLQDEADREYQDLLLARYQLRNQKNKDQAAASEQLADLDCQIDKKRKELLQTQDTVRTAEQYLDLVKHAVVEAKSGKNSDLLIDPEESAKYGCNHVTKVSFEKWRKDNSKLIAEIGPALSIAESPIGHTDGLSPTKKDNLLATLGLFAQVFSETGARFKHGENLNVLKIAERLHTYAKEANGQETLSGQSVDAIRKRILEALQALAEKLPAGKS